MDSGTATITSTYSGKTASTSVTISISSSGTGGGSNGGSGSSGGGGSGSSGGSGGSGGGGSSGGSSGGSGGGGDSGGSGGGSTSAPSSPSNFDASVNGSSITFSWAAVSGATGYRLKYGTSRGSYANSAELGNRTSLTTGPLPDGNYYVVLIAYNSGGESGYSGETSISIGSYALSSSVNGSTLNLSWNGASGVTNSRLYYGVSPGNYIGSLDFGNVASTSIGNVPNGTYYLMLAQYIGSREIGKSGEISVKFNVDALSAPSGFNVSSTGGTVNLNWSAVAGASGYKLYYGTSSGNYIGSIDLGNVTSRSFENIPGGTYYLTLTAYSSTHESSKSGEEMILVANTGNSYSLKIRAEQGENKETIAVATKNKDIGAVSDLITILETENDGYTRAYAAF